MAIVVRLKKAWQRYSKRYDTEEPLDSEQAYLLKTIQPVTLIDDILKDLKQNYETVVRLAASGAGYEAAYTVPEGKRATVYMLTITRSAGDGTITNIWVTDEVPTLRKRLFTQTAASAVHLDEKILAGIPLPELYTVDFQVNAISTDSTWACAVLVEEEEAYE